MSTRERRKAETARGLRETARRLTIERGLAGFTVDELCDEVGVSRRTLFNYYASKENAVIGVPVDLDESGAAERFLAAGPRGFDHLVDDIVALHLERWEFGGMTADDVKQLILAVDREPRLAAHVLKLVGEGERDDIRLVESREGLAEGDLRAAAAVQLVAAIVRASAEELFQLEGTDGVVPGPSGSSASEALPVIVRRRLAVVRELFH